MIDLICAFVAMLAAAAFAQFGVTLKTHDKAPTPEVHRTASDHARPPATSLMPGGGTLKLPSTGLPQPRLPLVGQKGR
jgi:hypothetical protein